MLCFFFNFSLPYTHICICTCNTDRQFHYLSGTLSFHFVVVGNGLNSPHNGERSSPADRQSTMPPSVPIRKDKKDAPVISLTRRNLESWQKIQSVTRVMYMCLISVCLFQKPISNGLPPTPKVHVSNNISTMQLNLNLLFKSALVQKNIQASLFTS